ncbi:MAG: zinc ribbon domain-containing protein [Clostridia bacterium]|nr:zinc ribbon domain-containing protein [Clostridia bacterium]
MSIICKECGKEVLDDSEFCCYCGRKIYNHKEKEEENQNYKKQVIRRNVGKTLLKIILVMLIIVSLIIGIILIQYINKKKNKEEVKTTSTTETVENYNSNMSIDQVEEFDFQPEVEVETDESGPKWNTSEIYREYKTLLDSYNSEASNIENMEVYYMITDINNDGVQEIIISHGAYNGDFINNFYTFKNHKILKIGQSFGAYSTLYKMNEGNYLKQVYLHGDYELIYDIYYENDKFEVINRGDRTLSIEENELDYEKKYNAKPVKAYDLNDTEELNNLRNQNTSETVEDGLDEDKAIELVKKAYGSSEGIYFKIEQINNNGTYIISVRDAETTNVLKYYTVDVKNRILKLKKVCKKIE